MLATWLHRSRTPVAHQLADGCCGAHARKALVQYLRTELPRLLRAGGASDVRRLLFSAAAESTQLAAWMAYGAGLHGLAQRYFIQALGLADAGEDRLLAASILDAMSHQASFLGRYREAANMARAARLGKESAGVPILTSHFYAMEARAIEKGVPAQIYSSGAYAGRRPINQFSPTVIHHLPPLDRGIHAVAAIVPVVIRLVVPVTALPLSRHPVFTRPVLLGPGVRAANWQGSASQDPDRK